MSRMKNFFEILTYSKAGDLETQVTWLLNTRKKIEKQSAPTAKVVPIIFCIIK